MVWPTSVSPSRYSGWHIARYFGKERFAKEFEQLVDSLTDGVSASRWLGSPSFRLHPTFMETRPQPYDEVAAKMAECFDTLYRGMPSANESSSHWLDDTPLNLLRARGLLRSFPSSRLIHIYRDPRDVLASYVTKFWGGDDIRRTSLRLQGIYRQWLTTSESLASDRVFEVSLESLIQSPAETLQRLSAFIGVPMEEAMWDIDLSRSNTGRWRTEIPSKDLDFVHEALHAPIKHYGYDSP